MNLKKLGRGLGSLMSDQLSFPSTEGTDSDIIQMPISRIQPNPNQPRKAFDQEKLQELTSSIKTHGILQPITVWPSNPPDIFEIIMGERRWRAAQVAGLKTVPVIILTNIDQRKRMELSLIENLQREDLNPIEKAQGYKALLDQFHLTQEQVGECVGQNRSTVANMLRLLELPLDIQNYVSRGTLTMGHARALLALQTHESQRIMAEKAIRKAWSVREVEKAVAIKCHPPGLKSDPQNPQLYDKSPHINNLELEIMQKIGCKSYIQLNGNNRGKLIIEFSDNNDFERILQCLSIPLTL